VENLKRYEYLLEDLGEEANNFEKIIKKTYELKNSQLEEEIDMPSDIADAHVLDGDHLEVSEESTLKDEPEDEYQDDSNNEISTASYIPDKDDKIIDEIFSGIDTPEYLEKEPIIYLRPNILIVLMLQILKKRKRRRNLLSK